MSDLKEIHYVEIPAKDLEATKAFFIKAFGWSFEDFGPEYTAYTSPGGYGGFYQSELSSNTEGGAALVVFYCRELEKTLRDVKDAGGVINKEIFPFPGGRRFHFIEPSGNEFAVWSDCYSRSGS
ncbi:MAG: VOC family protein [Endozoicomonas sp.]